MNLNKLLSSNSSFNNTSTLKCPYCEFVGTNVKSLAAHQRRCKNNKTIVSNEEANIKIDTRSDESITEQVDTDTENKSIDECENEIVEKDNKTKKQKTNKKISINDIENKSIEECENEIVENDNKTKKTENKQKNNYK